MSETPAKLSGDGGDCAGRGAGARRPLRSPAARSGQDLCAYRACFFPRPLSIQKIKREAVWRSRGAPGLSEDRGNSLRCQGPISVAVESGLHRRRVDGGRYPGALADLQGSQTHCLRPPWPPQKREQARSTGTTTPGGPPHLELPQLHRPVSAQDDPGTRSAPASCAKAPGTHSLHCPLPYEAT